MYFSVNYNPKVKKTIKIKIKKDFFKKSQKLVTVQIWGDLPCYRCIKKNIWVKITGSVCVITGMTSCTLTTSRMCGMRRNPEFFLQGFNFGENIFIVPWGENALYCASSWMWSPFLKNSVSHQIFPDVSLLTGGRPLSKISTGAYMCEIVD